VDVPKGDFAATAVSNTGKGTWNAEMRISLEWLGGYARTDGFSLAVDQVGGQFYARWPAAASASAPATWGDLVLEPLYPDPVAAGSVFLDGREGYLVVPYAAQLNPSEITIEAWVKIVDGDCGTLAGNGLLASYWLAVCQTIQFGYGGADSMRRGQHPLGDGWHHVAVTMGGPDGIRTFYLDGLVDVRPGWEPAQEGDGEGGPPPALGASDRMLRIGSDRDATADLDRLHAYVSELRIWNRVRTAGEIRAAAFQRLKGTEPGLVADWPFTSGLRDVLGRYPAGLVGNASLAKETRDVTAFPVIPPPPAYTYPPRVSIPAWSASIPAPSRAITLDGMCSLGEYPANTRLILEPDHELALRVALAPDALYLCTGLLWGSPSLHGEVTLWIDRDGRGSSAPGPTDLRLMLSPDGRLVAHSGDGSGYTGPAPGGIVSKTITDTKLALQEDAYPVLSPWWESEVRIPFSALTPFAPSKPLRFAVRYEGTMAAKARPGQPQPVSVTASWPRSFDPASPATWGAATTSSPIYLPAVWGAGSAASAVAVPTPASDARPPADNLIIPSPEQIAAWQAQGLQAPAAWPRNPPNADDFNAKCPDAAAITYLGVPELKWPLVDPSFQIVQSEGTMSEFGISREDSFLIHTSHDMDMKLSVAYEDRWKVLDGGDSQVIETESGWFDAAAIAGPGDHATVKGRWIFDCGHDPKTEIHPAPMFEVDRETTLPDGVGFPGKQATVRRVRVHMSAFTGAFYYDLGSIGPFTFSASMPAHGYATGNGFQLPFIRVVQGPASAVALTGFGAYGKAQITITPPGGAGPYDWELYLGYLDPEAAWSGTSKPYIVTLDAIQVLDDLDGGAPDCHGPHDCGEWYLYVGFNRQWNNIWWNTTVYDGDDPYPMGQQYRTFGFNLELGVLGYENDDPFAGDAITSGGWDLGSLSTLCCGQHEFQPGGDWKIWYTVSQGDQSNPTALPLADSPYWIPRLQDEPNASLGGYLGSLPVPPVGAPALMAAQHSAYITQKPLQRNDVRVLGADVDRYTFSLVDFATVEFGALPAGVHLQLESPSPWEFYDGTLPPALANLLGFRSATLKIYSNSASIADQAYTLVIKTTARVLPLDWGEADDAKHIKGVGGGRLVDLVTPDPAADVESHTLPDYQSRALVRDWAWQHVAGDVDYYDIWIPPVAPRPSDKPLCEYEMPGGLSLEATSMALSVPSQGLQDGDYLEIGNLNALFPNGHVLAEVRHPTNRRGFYRLQATWNDAGYLTKRECDLLRTLEAMRRRLSGRIEPNWRSVYVPALDRPDPAPEVFGVAVRQLGGMQPVRPGAAGTFDAVISSFRAQPVLARLYGMDGVLVGEGKPLGAESAGLRVADGQLPQSRLRVTGLTAGQNYLVQIVPQFDVGPSGAQEIRVGFTQSMAAQ